GSPKHPHSPSTQQNQQQQQQLHGSQHQPPPSHQQSHGRDQIRDHPQQQPQHRGVPTPGSPTRGSPPQGLPLSPPPLSAGGGPGAPPGMVPRMPGLPPPGLGLLGQLGGMLSGHHGSPLELMAAHHAVLPPRSYNSPPPISTSDPTANECKLVDYRGQKVAAFIIAGDTMLCLPQAFELFLKHLVGGLHTVYTKLKRLDIVPLVCNVEQVRILRGLGAIQPGVNRCKLLSCKDFDILYRDCTTARELLNLQKCRRVGRWCCVITTIMHYPVISLWHYNRRRRLTSECCSGRAGVCKLHERRPFRLSRGGLSQRYSVISIAIVCDFVGAKSVSIVEAAAARVKGSRVAAPIVMIPTLDVESILRTWMPDSPCDISLKGAQAASLFVSSWRIRRAEETIPGCIISELPSAPREKERQKCKTESTNRSLKARNDERTEGRREGGLSLGNEVEESIRHASTSTPFAKQR
ncbi:Dachshund like protein 1, partial [Trachymyrmex zeteki]